MTILMTGGFGINLACANVVIIFDGSFNPHDDKQAEDRAHRVGQTRDVTVIRLVTKDTIEEQILHLANTKLALDQEMSNVEPPEDEEKAEREGEKFVARMLIGKNGEDTPLAGSVVPSRVVTPALE
jgi:SWI/SNF-related matrix-associated actin-dependent regulator of chromatin subfamily A containing DEAD/H box 1